MDKIISLGRMMAALSLALDFSHRGLSRHHQRVAFTGLSLAEELGLSQEEKVLLFTAAIIHDVGAITWREKKVLEEFEIKDSWEHCRRGCELVSRVGFLKPLAETILSHHDCWARPNPSGCEGAGIPLTARIIHLADRVDVLLRPERYVLDQRGDILYSIERLAGQIFDPELVRVFENVARQESFWLDLTSPFMLRRLQEFPVFSLFAVHTKDLLQLAELFAAVVDAKSPFTYQHSRRVAAVAEVLAAEMGFSADELTLIKMAGLLHDLGKVSVPEEILEKPGSLTAREFNIIKQHTYYTYRILEEVRDLDPIPGWAAYHHEKLNGNGYPFHLDGSQLSPGARIMAVSDVYTALREDRPYRPGMKRPDIERILQGQVVNGALDPQVVGALGDMYDRLEEVWAQVFSKSV